MAIYEVVVVAPAVNETVVISAESEDQAKELVMYGAFQRSAKAASVTVRVVPDDTPVTDQE